MYMKMYIEKKDMYIYIRVYSVRASERVSQAFDVLQKSLLRPSVE